MKNYLVGGLVIIALTNIVVLTGVAYNRSKPHVNTIELSGREFRLPRGYGLASESSAKIVHLIARMPNKTKGDETRTHGIFDSPLTEQQLASLGLVGLEKPQSTKDALFGENYYQRYQAEVYVAIEFNGSQYQRVLTMQETETNDLLKKMESSPDSVPDYVFKNAKRRLKEERSSASRLFYVDAHMSSDTLMQKYKDQANIFLTKGHVNITVNKDAEYIASWASLLVDQIMIPSDIAQTITEENLEDSNLLFTLHIGKRFEPWVSKLEMRP